MEPRLIVHGGAWDIPDGQVEDHIRGVRRAVSEVFPRLRNGLSALDAVEAAVNVLEEDPTFDSGRGAVLNAQGEIELDAMIMEGAELRYGAVAAVQDILHPVTLARAVMERTEHCFLVGSGAQQFARRIGMPAVQPQELLTEREWNYYQQHVQNNPNYTARQAFEPAPMDTVGAVALDCQGNLAAATSTGGTAGKLPGRVGDSPLLGAGAYADNTSGAASATGWGEYIMRVLLSKTACDLLLSLPADEAARRAVRVLEARVRGLGGVILIDRHGHYGLAHNTPRMAFAYAEPEGQITAGIKRSPAHS
jgi:beta-aspartyl-peptidase (threonine type)